MAAERARALMGLPALPDVTRIRYYRRVSKVARVTEQPSAW